MKILGQIGILCAICLLGEGIASILPIPFPASVISLVLVFLLLAVRWLRVEQIQEVSSFLIQNMSFFFIPAGVGILESFGQIQDSLLPLLAVLVLTTIITFGVTALTVGGIIRLQEKRREP